MRLGFDLRWVFTILGAWLLLTGGALAQTAGAGSPVGHWVAEGSGDGGMGSWWDFR